MKISCLPASICSEETVNNALYIRYLLVFVRCLCSSIADGGIFEISPLEPLPGFLITLKNKN